MTSEAAREEARKFIDVSPIAGVVTDPLLADNPIIAVNSAFIEMTGYTAAELIGRNCRLLAGPGTDPEAQGVLRAAIAKGRSAIVELVNYRRDGTSFRNAVMIAPVRDSAGAVRYFVGSQMEVDFGGASQRRSSAQERIARLSSRQSEVLGCMARGLRHAAIAQALGITVQTVKMHRGALVARLDCRTSAEAVRVAVEAGL